MEAFTGTATTVAASPGPFHNPSHHNNPRKAYPLSPRASLKYHPRKRAILSPTPPPPRPCLAHPRPLCKDALRVVRQDAATNRTTPSLRMVSPHQVPVLVRPP
jgi:hypothetical protein